MTYLKMIDIPDYWKPRPKFRPVPWPAPPNACAESTYVMSSPPVAILRTLENNNMFDDTDQQEKFKNDLAKEHGVPAGPGLDKLFERAEEHGGSCGPKGIAEDFKYLWDLCKLFVEVPCTPDDQ